MLISRRFAASDYLPWQHLRPPSKRGFFWMLLHGSAGRNQPGDIFHRGEGGSETTQSPTHSYIHRWCLTRLHYLMLAAIFRIISSGLHLVFAQHPFVR